MNNMSNKQKITAITAIGAAAIFGMLSFGSSAQAATHSYNCQFMSGVLGLACCDRMVGSQVINVNASCHEPKKVFNKPKLRRRPPPPPTITLTEIPFAIERAGGANSDSVGGKDPNSLQ